MSELLEPGRVLGGRYRLVHEIARGGMGTVWEADDPLLARHVAVKTLDPVIGRDETVRARFRREAVTAAGTGCMAALDAEKYLAAQEFEAIAAE